MSNKDDSLLDEDFGDLFNGMEETDADAPKVKPIPKSQPKQVIDAEVKEVTKPQANLGDGFNPEEGETVSLGTKVSSIPIPRFKATKEGKARIALLSDKALAMKTHYVEGLGNFICFGGKCCEMEGLPRVRYVIPVVQYDCNSKGSVISNTILVKALSLGDDAYTALADAIQFSGRNAKDVDIIVTCSDEQYQKLTFSADASKGATWRTFDDETKKEMIAYFKANKDKLGLGIAKKVSPEVYLTKKGFVNAGAPAVSTALDVDDLLDE